jgi:hypothetical protein
MQLAVIRERCTLVWRHGMHQSWSACPHVGVICYQTAAVYVLHILTQSGNLFEAERR